MNIDDFVKNFADQFDDTDPSEINAKTAFHDLEEWSSLIALSVLNMVEKKYGTDISFDDLKNSATVEDIFNIIKSKK